MKKAQPIVFHVPPPFPYQNSKIVPWKYIATVSVGGEEVQVPSAEIVNISCSRGMTHNGHVSAPKYTPKVVPTPIIVPTYTLQAEEYVCVPTTLVGTLIPSMTKGTSDNSAEASTLRGKEAINEKQQVEKTITAEEGQEFLKLIKRSDFKFVDQLGQTPSKISILSLLLSL